MFLPTWNNMETGNKMAINFTYSVDIYFGNIF